MVVVVGGTPAVEGCCSKCARVRRGGRRRLSGRGAASPTFPSNRTPGGVRGAGRDREERGEERELRRPRQSGAPRCPLPAAHCRPSTAQDAARDLHPEAQLAPPWRTRRRAVRMRHPEVSRARGAWRVDIGVLEDGDPGRGRSRVRQTPRRGEGCGHCGRCVAPGGWCLRARPGESRPTRKSIPGARAGIPRAWVPRGSPP